MGMGETVGGDEVLVILWFEAQLGTGETVGDEALVIP